MPGSTRRGTRAMGRRRIGRALRGLLVLSAFAALGSCSSTPEGPPRAQGDICTIFEERPAWREAMVASSARWGAPVAVQMAIIWRESSFRAEARTPRTYALGVIPTGRVSSAYGFAQAIDGTWEWYRDDSGNGRADRTDFEDAADFVGWYMAKTESTNGIPMNDAFNQYLAYHEGHTGYRRGGWRGKGWLRRIAGQVEAQAQLYDAQLAEC
ncbi:MAG: transglycosylase SLT domain-containing protein [Pseudomonadota bacterium]